MTTITLPSPLALDVRGTIGVWGSYRLTFNHNNQTASWSAALYALEPKNSVDYYLAQPSPNLLPPPAGQGYTTESVLHNKSQTIAYDVGATYELPYVKKTWYSVFSNESGGPPDLTTIDGNAIPTGMWIYYNLQAYRQINVQEFFVGFLSSMHIGEIPTGWVGTSGGDSGGGGTGETTYPLYLLRTFEADKSVLYFVLDDPPMTEAEGLGKGYTFFPAMSCFVVFW